MPADNIGIASKVSAIASEIDAMPILRIGFANAGDAMRGPASLTPMRCDKRMMRCDADARITSVSSLERDQNQDLTRKEALY
ncbi:hypothetical protein PGTUg99_025195 [Puccinia graminis f. sp. tritici]|uniref:Uncharacterized protein n=1 Tax=Puccinia graminis f. sp. tritici TaxID=56615 RepID=A0A5B0S088_PUCGR|nr:hypothetical protein PGTUg99_025195 [Puccinia graminis f. sp. tritici]